MRKRRKKHLKKIITPLWQKILFVSLILVGLIFSTETMAMNLAKYQPQLKIIQQDNQLLITWAKYFYPTIYEVNVAFGQPGSNTELPLKQVTYTTLEPKLITSADFPLYTYWEVSARGIFHRSLGQSPQIMLAEALGQDVDNKNFKPSATTFYPNNAPASAFPTLRWTVVSRAVQYELELLAAPPEQPNDSLPSANSLFVTQNIFTNGCQLNLTPYEGNHFYWRVRALDFKGNPIGTFSDIQELYVNKNIIAPLKPVLNTDINFNDMATPLYPVFSFIPIYGAHIYELEITNAPPENPNDSEPSKYRIASMQVKDLNDFYYEHPMAVPGTYYWRVRGLDEDGNPIGVFSDAGAFTVDLSKGQYACTLGDSITHGGGGVSYSPADVEYNYQTYLHFPVVNIGKSGDTSAATNERFDQDVLPYHPKFLIIMTGTNSLRGGVPASEVIRDLATIRDKCLVYGIRPIFLTLPPINPAQIYKVFGEEAVPNWQQEFQITNDFIRKQRYYIDIAPYLTDKNGELPVYYAVDGLHFDIEGKKVMAQVINARWNDITR